MDITEIILDKLKNIEDDIKAILRFQSTTEERLKTGTRRFEDHEDRIRKVESRPRIRPGLLYGMIGIGFTGLGILITMVK